MIKFTIRSYCSLIPLYQGLLLSRLRLWIPAGIYSFTLRRSHVTAKDSVFTLLKLKSAEEIILTEMLILQHKLKSSQREKVRQFISFTETGEKTSINCLSQHDWKLDIAVDNYYQNPDRYNREPRGVTDRKRIEQLFNRYRGKRREA